AAKASLPSAARMASYPSALRVNEASLRRDSSSSAKRTVRLPLSTACGSAARVGAGVMGAPLRGPETPHAGRGFTPQPREQGVARVFGATLICRRRERRDNDEARQGNKRMPCSVLQKRNDQVGRRSWVVEICLPTGSCSYWSS